MDFNFSEIIAWNGRVAYFANDYITDYFAKTGDPLSITGINLYKNSGCSSKHSVSQVAEILKASGYQNRNIIRLSGTDGKTKTVIVPSINLIFQRDTHTSIFTAAGDDIEVKESPSEVITIIKNGNQGPIYPPYG